MLPVNEEKLVEDAAAIAYKLVDRKGDGREWQWEGPGPTPFFLDRGEALRWVADYLPRRRQT